MKELIKDIKESLELLKLTFVLSLSHTKIFIHSFIATIIPTILEFLAFLLSLYLSKNIGILDVVNVSMEQMIFMYLITKIYLSLTGIVDWKSSISDILENGSIVNYLLRPKKPFLLDAFLTYEGHWLQYLITIFLIFLIFLVYYDISLINLLKTTISSLIIIIFSFSLSIFVRSLDLLLKGLTRAYYDFSNSFYRYLEAYPPKYYEKLGSYLLYGFFFLSYSFISFFVVVPTLIEGKICYNYLVFFIIVSLILFPLSKKFWEYGLRKYEGYL